MDTYKNLASSRIVVAPSPALSGTSFTVTAAQGARFPTTAHYVAVKPRNQVPTLDNCELLRVTRSVDTFTVVGRAQGGSSARAIIAGDDIYQPFLTEDIASIVALIDAVADGDVVGPASAVTARIATFSGTTGKLIQDGGSTIAGVLASALAAATSALLPVSLTSGVSGRLPFANLSAATAASRLLGRRAGSAGDLEELSLGNSLALTTTVLDTIQDIRTSASPTFAGAGLIGNLTLGTQGSAAYKVRLAHTEPGGANPSAYHGIFPATFTWTNHGTYYDNTVFYGWNGDVAQADEPSIGFSVESKYSQDGSSPFGVELHHVATFPDATTVRVLTHFIDRAAPHLALTTAAGQYDFATSSTAAAQNINLRIYEDGSVTFWGPASGTRGPVSIANYASSASVTGKGRLDILSSDSYPAFLWKKGGAEKVRLEVDLDGGSVTAILGNVVGNSFKVRNGFFGVTQNSVSLPAFTIQNNGGDFCWFSNNGSDAKFRVLTGGGLVWSTDTSLTPISAGLLGVGTGAAASFAGGLKMTALTTVGVVIHTNLPTSASGLATGQLWNNGGVVNVA